VILNFLYIFAWSSAGLWIAAFFWTRHCLKGQKPLAVLQKAKSADKQPQISVIVPARNEAQRILEASIFSMLAQDYENFEVIVLDDCSTDDTKEILREISEKQSKIQTSKFKIVEGVEPDKPWLGKPYALEQALQCAQIESEWILATDADIIFAPGALQTAVAYAVAGDFDALTLIPGQVFGSFWERLFMPVFAWFCVFAMPLHRVNDASRSESIGVGNFFMLRRDVLEKIGGFGCVKTEVAEDLRLAEILKKQGFKLRVDYAPDLITTRMYAGLREIWEGFTKNLFSGMKFSPVKTVFSAFSIFMCGVLPIFFAAAALWFGNFALFVSFLAVYVLQVAVFALVRRVWCGCAIYAFLMPLGLALFLMILINSMVKILTGKGVTWKGRTIYNKNGMRPPFL
jgi:chlorobactene glucosyltransferase